MKSDIVIKAEGIGKKYSIDIKKNEPYSLLHEEISTRFKNLFSRNKFATYDKKQADVWVLDNIDFEISRGDVVGIIGGNGAGKSTLLKIISRITPPSTGMLTISGRVSSLLEVGTGFHPELTGRQNIFLNGAILGMRSKEIKRNFDAIVDFAGIEKYIDTPVKRYSSGMYVRLAFSVAIHLESEILILDEVLAVGDLQFQKKCADKMHQYSKRHDKTILFVSHSIEAVSSMCNKSMLLEGGKLIDFSYTPEIVEQYIGREHAPSRALWEKGEHENNACALNYLYITDCDYGSTSIIERSQGGFLIFSYSIKSGGGLMMPYVALFKSTGELIYVSAPKLSAIKSTGDSVAAIRIPSNILNTGRYEVEVGIGRLGPSTFFGLDAEVFVRNAVGFEVTENIVSEDSHFKGNYPGAVKIDVDWNLIGERL